MKTNQPSWHCVANLGDATPEDHGGAFVMVDKRGVYCPELLMLEPNEDNEESPSTLYTVMLELCTRCKGMDGAISDNRFHNDSPAWFGTLEDLKSSADICGVGRHDLADMLCSSCPIERAQGYQVLVGSHGLHNFDQHPALISREDSLVFCASLLKQVEESTEWKDGMALPESSF